MDVALAHYNTGVLLSTWTSPSISAGAEMQVGIKAIEDGVGIIHRPYFYTASIRPTFVGYFQHVLWLRSGGTLTNMSICDTVTTSDVSTGTGVHSSIIGEHETGYPSLIVLHNTDTSSAVVTLGVYDARDGEILATYSAGSIPPNGQLIVEVSDIESDASPPIITSGTMYHYIIKVEDNFTGHLKHLVSNIGANVVTDMTGVCTLVAGTP